ncbi:MAG: NAD-dependent deacylase [Nonlabens sp.]
MKNLVVLTGAGISAESGIRTFRDENGLWEGHDVMEVASPDGFKNNPSLVLDFYNQRRAQLKEVRPNDAHYCLAGLERNFNVDIITQNVDDLHERAGSSKILHLHGELLKARGSRQSSKVVDCTGDIALGNLATDGSQLRPAIVWFGEEVPAMETAIDIVGRADILMIVGTSLQVYPAAGLMDYAPPSTPIYLIDPRPATTATDRITVIEENATVGIPLAADLIYSRYYEL